MLSDLPKVTQASVAELGLESRTLSVHPTALCHLPELVGFTSHFYKDLAFLVVKCIFITSLGNEEILRAKKTTKCFPQCVAIT